MPVADEEVWDNVLSSVSYFLRKRGLVDDTGSYIHLMRIDKRTNELVYEEKTEKGTEEKIEESPEK